MLARLAAKLRRAWLALSSLIALVTALWWVRRSRVIRNRAAGEAMTPPSIPRAPQVVDNIARAARARDLAVKQIKKINQDQVDDLQTIVDSWNRADD